MSMLLDVTGTGESRGKGKAPKEGEGRYLRPRHMVKNHVTVIWQDGELLKEEKIWSLDPWTLRGLAFAGSLFAAWEGIYLSHGLVFRSLSL